MKCPLFYQNEMTDTGVWRENPRDCLREECAWWDKMYERCDPTGLAHTLERLTDTITEIERKME